MATLLALQERTLLQALFLMIGVWTVDAFVLGGQLHPMKSGRLSWTWAWTGTEATRARSARLPFVRAPRLQDAAAGSFVLGIRMDDEMARKGIKVDLTVHR